MSNNITQTDAYIKSSVKSQAQRRSVHKTAHSAAHLIEKLQKAADALKNWESNNPGLDSTAVRSMAVIFLSSVVAVFFLDFIALNPMSSFLAGLAFSGNDLLITISTYLVPFCVIMIEINISTRIYDSKKSRDESGKVLHYILWIIMGLLFNSVVAIFIVSSGKARLFAEGNALSHSFYLLWGLAVLSVSCHAVIIFGGEMADEAKNFFSKGTKKWFLSNCFNRRDRKYHRCRIKFVNAYTNHVQWIRLHCTTFPSAPLEYGPFDKITQSHIDQLFPSSNVDHTNGNDTAHTSYEFCGVASKSIAFPSNNGESGNDDKP